MSGYLHVTALGNLGTDPVMRQTKNGDPVVSFRLAVNTYKQDTEWFSVSAFGKTAASVGEYLKKGSQALIDGTIRTSTYVNKDGDEVIEREIVAKSVTFVGAKGGGGNQYDDSPF